jgi:hypothetical protein
MPRKLKIAECHPDRKHYAKNMCGACYQKMIESKREVTLRAEPEILSSNGWVNYVMANWEQRLEEPGMVEDIIRNVFNGPAKRKGTMSA